jgi:hypothetical protein
VASNVACAASDQNGTRQDTCNYATVLGSHVTPATRDPASQEAAGHAP